MQKAAKPSALTEGVAKHIISGGAWILGQGIGRKRFATFQIV